MTRCGPNGLMLGQGKPPRPPPRVKTTPDLDSRFSNLVWRAACAKPDWKNESDHFLSLTQGGARSSLTLGYFLIVLSGLQLGSLRSHFI